MDALYDLPFARAPHPSLPRADPRVRDGEALDRHDARLLRRLHVLLASPSTRAASSRSARAESVLREVRALLAHGRLLAASITDLGGPDRQHVQDDVQGRDDRERLPPALVRAPGHLREPGHRSRAAHRPDEEGARGEGHQERLHRLGRSLRPRRAQPRVHRRARAAPHRRPALGRARAQQAGRARQDEEARHRELRALRRRRSASASEKAGKEQYLVPYFITGHPGSTLDGHGRARALPEEQRHAPAPGAGLHPDADVDGDDACTTRASIRSRGEPVYTARDLREKRLQKALHLLLGRAARPLAREALKKAGEATSSAADPHALVPPEGAADRVAAAAAGAGGPRTGPRPPQVRGKPTYGRARAVADESALADGHL